MSCGRCRRQIGTKTPTLAYRWAAQEYHRDCLINALADSGSIAVVVSPPAGGPDLPDRRLGGPRW